MRDLRGLIKNDVYDQGGWCIDEKRNLIHNLIKTTHSKVCVEIGVYKGSSLFSFAEVLEKIEGKIIGIDHGLLKCQKMKSLFGIKIKKNFFITNY